MLHKAKGIVLRHHKYSDTSIIVTMYTNIFGRQSFMIHSVNSRKNKQKLSLFQTLNILNFEMYHSPKRELQRIKEIQFEQPYISIPFEIKKSSVALFIAEILYKTLKEEESNSAMFEFIINSLQIFDLADQNPNFHIYFLVQLSKHLGFFPHNNYEKDSFFDLKTANFYPTIPLHSHHLNQNLSLIFSQFMIHNSDQHRALLLNGQIRNELLEKIVEFYKLHHEGMGTINSLEILKDIFH